MVFQAWRCALCCWGAGQRTFHSGLFALIAAVAEEGPKDDSFAVVSTVRSAAFGLGSLTTAVLLTTVSDTGLRIAVCVHTTTLILAAALLAIDSVSATYPADEIRGSEPPVALHVSPALPALGQP